MEFSGKKLSMRFWKGLPSVKKVHWMVLFASLVPSSSGQTVPPGSASPAPHQIPIPDGTLVELRFAQAIVGSGSHARIDSGDSETAQADPGDKVSLVADADVRVHGVVIITKGSIAQASVTAVKSTLRTLSSGIGLKLEWIQDVNGNKLPLRATEEAGSGSVMIVVSHGATGVVAQPESMRKVIHLLTGKFRNTRLESIPVGTRIFGYTNGSVSFDAGNIQESADANAPVVITVYQIKEKASKPFSVECDGRPLGSVGPQHFLIFNLLPGAHTCGLHDYPMRGLTAESGGEYFLRIIPMDGTLKTISVGEGEDSIVGMEAIETQSSGETTTH